jgi:hypothetical protein
MANGPRLFRQLVRRALVTVSDLEVVGVIANLTDLTLLIECDEPDWLIAALRPDGLLPEMVEAVLTQFPSLNVLGVALDGGRIKTWWAHRREEETFTDITFEEMIRILRYGSGQRIGPGASSG